MKRSIVNRRRMRAAAEGVVELRIRRRLLAHGEALQEAAKECRRNHKYAAHLVYMVSENTRFTKEEAQEYVSRLAQLSNRKQLLELETAVKQLHREREGA